MTQLKRWLITLLFLFAIVAILGFVKFTQIKAAIAFGESFPEASETVQIIEVFQSSWQPNLQVMGEIKAIRSVELRNEFEGMITEVGFESGASVKQGDVLIQLNIAPELAELDAINAEIELAKLDVKRLSDLLKLNASSKDQFDRANSLLAVNRARARALEATIDRKTIRAPFDGVAGIHDWEVGTYIAANTLITSIVGDLSKVWVDFAVPQWNSNIKLGSTVKIAMPELLSDTLLASVTAMNQQINSTSRSMQVRASLENPQQGLKPGAFVSVLLPIDSEQTVYPVPNEALRFDTFGSYVYKLEKDEKGDWRAKRQAVSFAARELDTAMVTSGIESGDVIATVGSAKLSEGLLVYAAPAQSGQDSE
uniref:efflux RND transporter periplasmic adaptor subunit n=1 Tax=Ningiella ruwaisensis TaxID=2364274 RepID=UPI00109EE491|nr:efflux RND transporter periplasmic adaptor subunit [Ningiella ruwaisensis]